MKSGAYIIVYYYVEKLRYNYCYALHLFRFLPNKIEDVAKTGSKHKFQAPYQQTVFFDAFNKLFDELNTFFVAYLQYRRTQYKLFETVFVLYGSLYVKETLLQVPL